MRKDGRSTVEVRAKDNTRLDALKSDLGFTSRAEVVAALLNTYKRGETGALMELTERVETLEQDNATLREGMEQIAGQFEELKELIQALTILVQTYQCHLTQPERKRKWYSWR